MNIEELIEKIDNICADANFSETLRTLLTTYTCEVAKIDEGIFYDIYMKMKINGVSEHVNEYNRLITEKYQAKEYVKCTCTNSLEYSNCAKKCDRVIAENSPEPKLRVGWEYQNKKGKWIEITSKDGHSSHPYNSVNHGSFTTRGKWGLCRQSDNDLILSTGRPVQKQPSPNWWESLKEGDLVKCGDDVLKVKNWYQEQLGEKRIWIVWGGYVRTLEHYKPYTPTPTEAIADLKAGKITVEQFKKVYKG